MRTIAVVSVARSDFSLYLPILQRIKSDKGLRLQLIVGGMHLSPEFGMTITAIEQAGFEISERVEMLISSDSPQAIAKSIGIGTMGFAQAYERLKPDLLLVLGDRFEMLAAVIAALPFAIPTAHIHGGESTEGLIDEPIRHSITKMSHLHFVTTEKYRQRVIQMGEQPKRVILSGAPGLDNLREMKFATLAALEQRIGMALKPAPLLVTFHPVTLEYQDTPQHIATLLKALEGVDRPIIFTYPNADTGGRIVIAAIDKFTATRPQTKVVANLGTEWYFTLMRHAAVMVGNSSSGIIEAASFELPVVNIGNRQRGRIHGPNVLDVGYGTDEIRAGIQQALRADFRKSLAGLKNPYGDGNASKIIVDTLKQVPLDRTLVVKKFHDLAGVN